VICANVEELLSMLNPNIPTITIPISAILIFQWRFRRWIFIKKRTTMVPKRALLDKVNIIALHRKR